MAEMPRNPYVTGGPLTAPNQAGFYGRTEIYDFVEQNLNAVQRPPILLYGQRRIGKTSILRQMANRVSGDLVFVYFDLQGKALKPLDEVLFLLAREIRRHNALASRLDRPRREDITEETFAAEFLPRIVDLLGGDKHRLVLLFDEMDVIDTEQLEKNTEFAAYTFREYMRALMDEEQQLGYIYVVGRRPEELNEAFNAQLFRGAAQERIGHLSRSETNRLVTEPSEGYLFFPPEATEAIYRLTDGHPFCTQLICHQLWNRHLSQDASVPVSISPLDVETIVPDALIYGQTGLNWIHDGLTEPAHRLFLSAAAEVVDEEGNARLPDIWANLRKHRIGLPSPEVQKARNDLVSWGIMDRVRTDTYRFRVEMVRRWIATFRSLEHMRHEARFISRRAYRLYEEAEEQRQLGQIQDAIENYRRALDVYPQLIDAQLGLADSLRQTEDWSATIAAYEQLLELDPNQVDGLQTALLDYGLVLERQDQLMEAIRQYERAAELVENPRVQDRLRHAVRSQGQRLIEQEHYEEAITLFERFGLTAEADRAKEGQLRVWQRVEARVADLLRQTERPDWPRAYEVVRQYQQNNPGDKRSNQLSEDIRRQEVRWNNEQGDARLAVGQYVMALEFYRRSGNEERQADAIQALKQAERKAALSQLERARNTGTGWSAALSSARQFVQTYPDDSEMRGLVSEAEQECRQLADGLLAQEQFEQAVDVYEALGDRARAVRALLIQWQSQTSKSTREHLVWLAGVLAVALLGGAGRWFAQTRGWPSFVVILLLVIAALGLLASLYLLCRILFSGLLARVRLRRTVERQLEAVPAIAEARRLIHNAEYVRPILGSSLGAGIVLGAIGWFALVGLRMLIQPTVTFTLLDHLLGFLLTAFLGFGFTVFARTPEDQDSSTRELSPRAYLRSLGADYVPLVGCGGSSLLLGAVLLAIATWLPQFAPAAKYVVWGISAWGAIVYLLLAARNWRRVRTALTITTPVLNRFVATYALGDDHYDESFPIETKAGEYLGECGIGISETIGDDFPAKATAFEVWLFNKNEISTVVKVLTSGYAFSDVELRDRLAGKGELVLAQANQPIILETDNLRLEVVAKDVVYGTDGLPPGSFFERLTVELVSAQKVEQLAAPPPLGRDRYDEASDLSDVGHFVTSYALGKDYYDEAFPIETSTGEFLGECGICISETIGDDSPTKVTAFEVWLFDKNDIRTATKVLMSEYAFSDAELRARLAQKGDLVLAQANRPIILETDNLRLEVVATDVVYGTDGLPPDSFFERLTVELGAAQKVERLVVPPPPGRDRYDESEASSDAGHFVTSYAIGRDHYDESFSIETSTGEFLGECGIAISETIGDDSPAKVTAFEVWLFDKNEIRTLTKVLMSEYAFSDAELRARLAEKGELVLAQANQPIILSTGTMRLEAVATDVVYGTDGLPRGRFFERFTVEFTAFIRLGTA